MIEIDHTVQLAPPPPEPAKPILASRLLELEQKQRKRFAARGERIPTGCREVDDYVLGGGGFERGIVVGVSAGDGDEGRLISLHLLASILLSQPSRSSSKGSTPKSKAVIIDTTGSFPLSLLANVLKSRIRESCDLSSRKAVETANYRPNAKVLGAVKEVGVEEEVQRCLEMVAISRVFDVEGLWEVLSEVGRDARIDGSHDGSDGAVGDCGIREGDEGAESGPQPEIVDSDEEDNVISEPKPPPVQQQPPDRPTTTKADDEDQATEIIIIDNMTHLINDLFSRKERTEAHTLLSLLSQSLHTLTHTTNILTLLHNTTTTTQKPTHLSNLSSLSNPSNQPKAHPSSVFASNTHKPTLGQIFAQFTDLHILISPIPKSREDAENLYCQEQTDNVNASKDKVGYCSVLEVLKDETPDLSLGQEKEEGRKRFGAREQRWVALEVGEDGVGFGSAFRDRGTMKGLGLARGDAGGKVGGTETGVGDVNVGKIFGFGGRRV